MSDQSLSKPKRVFNWRSKTFYRPADSRDELEFGLIDPVSGNWLVKVTACWTIEEGQPVTMVRQTLADWSATLKLKDVASEIEPLTHLPKQLPAFRVALILCSLGFQDVTEYTASVTENELRRELRELEERVERIKDKLATGYYPH